MTGNRLKLAINIEWKRIGNKDWRKTL